jgi:uncharacterized membrane protein YcaP (DUF421 family)
MEAYGIVFLRIISIIPLLLFVTIYIMGKRPIGELPVFDFLIIVTMGAVVGADIADPSVEHLPTAFAIIILAIFQYIVSLAVLKNRKFARLISFEPTVVLAKGNFLVNNIRTIKYSIDEILMLLREKDVFNFKEVQYAIIESNGKITVLKKAETTPLTPKDMLITTQEKELSEVVILEGKMDKKGLLRLNKKEEEIIIMAAQQGYAKISDIFIAVYSKNSGLVISPYNTEKENIKLEH